MERTANINLAAWRPLNAAPLAAGQLSIKAFTGILLACALSSALLASWSWAIPVALALSSLNWLEPEFFSLAIVYLHPLVALWFLDRHLRRTRPQWLRPYRSCLCLLPLLLVGMFWQLAQTPALPDDNGLFWRITQHAGAHLLPNVSSRLLVSVHVFLEMLHYGVWLIALPLIAPLARPGGRLSALNGASRNRSSFWGIKTVPLARHRRGFPNPVN